VKRPTARDVAVFVCLCVVAAISMCGPVEAVADESGDGVTSKEQSDGATLGSTELAEVPRPLPEREGGTEKDAKERREQTLAVVALILVGITVIGLALIWAVMIWGRRLRRLANKRHPSPTVVDELWYLKPKKPIPGSGLEQSGGTEPHASEIEPR